MQTARQFLDIAVDSVRSSRMARCSLITAVALLLSVPFILRDANHSVRTMFNAPLRWIPRDSESRQQFNEFLDLFRSHELVVVSWPGCRVDDERLQNVAEALERVAEQRKADGEKALFTKVLSGYTMLDVLTREPIGLPRETALNRLKGVVVGPDGETSCVVIEVTDYGAEDRRTAMRVITETVTETAGLPRESLILAGPPVEGIAIDDESIRSIQRYSPASVLISMVLCWLCLRSLWMTLPVLIIGALGQGLMLASVHYLGESMNAILIVLPPLVFVLTISAGVHLVNYFFEESSINSEPDAAGRAVRNASGPCAMAAITTAIGMASLGVSVLWPVRQFGLLGSVGLLICVGVLFLLLPGLMVIVSKLPGPVRSASPTPSGSRRLTANSVARVVWRFGLPIRIVCFAAMLICSVGLARLQTSIDVVSLLSSDNSAVQDFRWFEDHIGPLIPVETVVHFDRECTLDPVQRLKIVKVVEQKVGEIDNVGGTMSAATFISSFPSKGGLRNQIRTKVFRRQIERRRDDLIAANYLAETDDGEAYRISGRVFGASDLNHGLFLDRLHAEVDLIITNVTERGHEGVTATSTGVTAVAYEIQESLLDDLFRSFLIALVLVAITMVIALRSLTCGLLAMLPNVFPTMLLFGSMGLADRDIDIGSVMTASVALGIAVDGTFHFLKWFVRSLKQGQPRDAAIAVAYQRCGRALIQTTFICACGLLIFTLSGFLPARNFAWMLMLMLIAALFGDLVLLPALLAGGLGRVLARIYNPQPQKAENLLGDATIPTPSGDPVAPRHS